MTQILAWRTFAQGRPAPLGEAGNMLTQFGPRAWATYGARNGVFEVDLIEDPEGSYWGWLSATGTEPTCLSDDRAGLHRRFLLGEYMKPGPEYAEARGEGRIIRFRAEIVRQVRK